MIASKPLGWGVNGFEANYMNWQASYFKENGEDDSEGYLADNIRHPLNEFIRIAVDYGIQTLVVIIVLMCLLVRMCIRKNSWNNKIFLLSLMMIVVWSMFSYPFSYSYSWLMLLIYLFLFYNENPILHFTKPITIGLVAASLFFLSYFGMRAYNEHKWYNAVASFLDDKSNEALEVLTELLPFYNDSPEHVYNYATILYNLKEYEKVTKIGSECRSQSANYELEILLGNSYFNLGKYEEAESHYLNASDMCPNRFVPLYKLFKIYKETSNIERMWFYGDMILKKRIKVPSSKIDIILNNVKYEMGGVE